MSKFTIVEKEDETYLMYNNRKICIFQNATEEKLDMYVYGDKDDNDFTYKIKVDK